MLNRILGSGTTPASLREGLSASSQRVREIASRVANAANQDFGSALDAAQGAGKVDVEREMVSLADEQLRFEASSRLLQKVYAQLRSSVRGA